MCAHSWSLCRKHATHISHAAQGVLKIVYLYLLNCHNQQHAIKLHTFSRRKREQSFWHWARGSLPHQVRINTAASELCFCYFEFPPRIIHWTSSDDISPGVRYSAQLVAEISGCLHPQFALAIARGWRAAWGCSRCSPFEAANIPWQFNYQKTTITWVETCCNTQDAVFGEVSQVWWFESSVACNSENVMLHVFWQSDLKA